MTDKTYTKCAVHREKIEELAEEMVSIQAAVLEFKLDLAKRGDPHAVAELELAIHDLEAGWENIRGLLTSMCARVDGLETKQVTHDEQDAQAKVYLSQGKWIIGLIITVLVSTLVGGLITRLFITSTKVPTKIESPAPPKK